MFIIINVLGERSLGLFPEAEVWLLPGKISLFWVLRENFLKVAAGETLGHRCLAEQVWLIGSL